MAQAIKVPAAFWPGINVTGKALLAFIVVLSLPTKVAGAALLHKVVVKLNVPVLLNCL